MSNRTPHVCPVEQASSLDNKFRRFFQDPHKILRPYVKEGMAVMDVGCGPGFFAYEMADMVGESGRVIAVDMQEGMLERFRSKIEKTQLNDRVVLHKCDEHKIGYSENIDFALLFYVAHEIKKQQDYFNEISRFLNLNGHMLIVEPPFHVSKAEFNETVNRAKQAGFCVVERPKVFLSKSVLMKKTVNSNKNQ